MKKKPSNFASPSGRHRFGNFLNYSLEIFKKDFTWLEKRQILLCRVSFMWRKPYSLASLSVHHRFVLGNYLSYSLEFILKWFYMIRNKVNFIIYGFVHLAKKCYSSTFLSVRHRFVLARYLNYRLDLFIYLFIYFT